MPRLPGRPKRNPFEARTQLWREVGLGTEIDREAAHRAQGGALVVMALIAGVLVLFFNRKELFPGYGLPVKIATIVLLLILGWQLARTVGRSLGPALNRRLDPGVAGTVGFLVRLVTVAAMVVLTLRIAGLRPEALAVGGAFTAVVLGLAAQQTLGNLIAGMVLLGTRPFRVGERIRLQGGFVAGELEGIVGSLGLFYTTLISGSDRVMVPNNTLLQLAVIPVREPDRVELRARFDASTNPRELQEMLQKATTVPLRHPPHVALEELDRDGVVVTIVATPVSSADGAKLAEEVLAAVRSENGGSPA